MKEVTVPVVKYQANDGKVFDSKEQALLHDDILSGKKRMCPICHGSKQVENIDGRGYITCGVCNGKGYQELKWV